MYPRPVCRFEFVGWCPVENKRGLYLSRFNGGGPTKFENTFFHVAKLRFLTKFTIFQKNFREEVLKLEASSVEL